MLAVAGLVGCGPNASGPLDPAIALHREQFTLAAEPDGALAVLDVAEAPPDDGEVAIFGRVGGGEISNPWQQGQAAFALVDPTAGDHEHCADDCAFCAKKDGPQPVAAVQFQDAHGQVAPLLAR